MLDNRLLSLLVITGLAVFPAVHADKSEKITGAEESKEKAKNPTKEELAKLKAAREKADAVPAVIAAHDKVVEAIIAKNAAKKGGMKRRSHPPKRLSTKLVPRSTPFAAPRLPRPIPNPPSLMNS